MSLRSLFWSFLLVLGVALGLCLVPPAGAAGAPPNTAAKYAGTYYVFILNYQTLFQFGGCFRVDTTGNVTGNMFDSNITVYPISGNIVNPLTGLSQGRFIINMINGANIYTASLNLTSVGQIVGRQENPGALFALSGAKYNNFFNETGTYYGQTTESPPRRMVLTIGLQRRISGTFEQIADGSGNLTYPVGNYTAVFGGANLAGFNGRSYLAKSFFNASWDVINPPANITANGTWRNASTAPENPNTNGTFNVYRILPTTGIFQGNFTPNYPPFMQVKN